MQLMEVSGAVRPLKWPLGVKWLKVRSCKTQTLVLNKFSGYAGLPGFDVITF
jgi:hypothetical protein